MIRTTFRYWYHIYDVGMLRHHSYDCNILRYHSYYLILRYHDYNYTMVGIHDTVRSENLQFPNFLPVPFELENKLHRKELPTNSSPFPCYQFLLLVALVRVAQIYPARPFRQVPGSFRKFIVILEERRFECPPSPFVFT